MGNSNTSRIRVAAVILRDDEILLIRHVRDNETYWLLPGGGVEYGETLSEALKRELMEEASIEIEVGHLIMVNDSIPTDKRRHIVNLYFTAEIIGGEMKLNVDERMAELKFMPLSELADLTFYPDTRNELLSAIREGFPHRSVYLENLWK